MTERKTPLEYPRKWYRVSQYGGDIIEREFVRETEKMLFNTLGFWPEREAKVGSYGRWYPSLEKAEEALAAIKARRAENARAEALRAAAPEMAGLLAELIDIEGPQPGTADWADKVRLLLTRIGAA